MTGNTVNEGLPYPGVSDFADVQDAFRLASAIDADLRAAQDPFRNFMARPSFIGLQTASQAGSTNTTQIINMTTVEWDNTGGVQPFLWNQPLSQPPSWWMFGLTIQVAATGAGTVGDLNMGVIFAQTADQISGKLSFQSAYQRVDDTGTSGEVINMFAIMPIYHGSAQGRLTVDGSNAKGIGAGSRFWGLYLGPVE